MLEKFWPHPASILVGLGSTCQANQILIVVSAAFERAVPDAPMSKGYASQAVYGQLLMALVFDETECQMRDRALVASIHAVFADFGSAIAALDERLARQLQAFSLMLGLRVKIVTFPFRCPTGSNKGNLSRVGNITWGCFP